MSKATVRYVRYVLSALAGVGFTGVGFGLRVN
jgi:hypothetical protein